MTGDDMKALRLLLGMTRKRLGHELGVSEQMIYQYETGGRVIARRREQQLARLAHREQVTLEARAPCPTCLGAGWVEPAAPVSVHLPAPPLPETAPLTLARVDDDDPPAPHAPAARGPGKPHTP
jgi:transcriptional regulator with XRE-family HTH domain